MKMKKSCNEMISCSIVDGQTKFPRASIGIIVLLLISLLFTGCSSKRSTIVRAVSVTPQGQFGNGKSIRSVVSGNGQFVVFESEATNLVDGIVVPASIGGFANHQIYIRDLSAKKTEIVSVDTAGNPISNAAYHPSISYDGRYVSFHTRADNVVPDLFQEGVCHVYVRDRESGTTFLVSKRSNGWRFSQNSGFGVLIPRGGDIYFSKGVSSHIYNHHFSSGETKVFVETGNSYGFIPEDSGLEGGKVIRGRVTSVGGGWFTFTSNQMLRRHNREGQSLPGSNTLSPVPLAYLYYTGTNKMFHLTYLEPGNEQPAQNNRGVSNSLFGPIAAFDSVWAQYINGDNDLNNATDIFVFDQFAYSHPPRDYIWRISKSSNGDEANGDSVNPFMSGPSLIVFESVATNLVTDDNNGKRDIFLHDREKEETTIVSRGGINGDTPSNGDSACSSISENGDVIVFQSDATNLVDLAHFPKPQTYVRRVVVTFSW